MRKILLVEDEPSIADNIVYALKTEGFAPSWCQTGHEALAKIADETFALVVLDVGLPDVNGFERCKQLRPVECPDHLCHRAQKRNRPGGGP